MRIKLFKCKKCYWVISAEDESNIGYAHAHAQKHVGSLGWNIKALKNIIPSKFRGSSIDELDDCIEKLEVANIDDFKFEKRARDLEIIGRRLEASISKPFNREEMYEEINNLYDLSDELNGIK